MKLLILVSSLDLTQPFSATPAWWQLMKGLYEIGVEVIAAPYQGPAIESLWWRTEANPAKFYGDSFKFARDTAQGFMPKKSSVGDGLRPSHEDKEIQESLSERLIRQTAQKLIAPIWYRHLDSILSKEGDIDAVIFLTVPLNHLVGVAKSISEKHKIPVFYYDGDVPASLPSLRGFASGFRIYQGADLSEYTAFISNSTGGADLLKGMGAKAAHTLWYAADPALYAPLSVEKDIDAFFFGHGREYRGEWIDAMLTEPSKKLDARFAVRGTNLGDLGKVEKLPYLSFSKLREYSNRSKLNLVITRGAHASVYGSSSMRPFELGAMGASMVANPYLGLELWFEPEKEIVIVNSGEEVLDRYRWLLAHDSDRSAIGKAARERVLKQHTFQHRAQELKTIIQTYL